MTGKHFTSKKRKKSYTKKIYKVNPLRLDMQYPNARFSNNIFIVLPSTLFSSIYTNSIFSRPVYFFLVLCPLFSLSVFLLSSRDC